MINLQNAMGRRLATVAVWAGVAVSAWYWTQTGLSAARGPAVNAAPAVASPDITSPADLARLLGAPLPTVAGPGPGPAERFTLVGVIASVTGQGAALISVDGKPARPFAVGTQIAPGYVLIAVGPRVATVADDPQSKVRTILSLPAQRDGTAFTAPAAGASASAPSAAPSAAPIAGEQITDTGPPARGDSRRQPPASLRREDRRGP